MNIDNPIYVTRPFLPPLEEFNEFLKKIWDNKDYSDNKVILAIFELGQARARQEIFKQGMNVLGNLDLSKILGHIK